MRAPLPSSSGERRSPQIWGDLPSSGERRSEVRPDEPIAATLADTLQPPRQMRCTGTHW